MILANRHDHWCAVDRPDGHFLVEIVRSRHHDLITRACDRQHRIEKRHVAAGCHDDLRFGHLLPVFLGQLGPDTGSQCLTTFYRTILVVRWITPERLNGRGSPRRGSEVDYPLP